MTLFNCTLCNYSTNKSSNYTKHIRTKKHFNNTKDTTSNTSNTSKSKHNTKCVDTNKQNLINKLITTSETNQQQLLNNTINKVCGYIYLLQYTNDKYHNVYKIGKSTNIKSRMRHYNNDYNIIYYFYTSNCHTAEKEIIKTFKSKFKQCKEFGIEYFRGECKSMIDIFINNSNKDLRTLINNHNNDNIKNGDNGNGNSNYVCEYCGLKFNSNKHINRHYIKACIHIPDKIKNRLIIKHNSNPRTKNKLPLVSLS
jgi:hypothetical protein